MQQHETAACHHHHTPCHQRCQAISVAFKLSGTLVHLHCTERLQQALAFILALLLLLLLLLLLATPTPVTALRTPTKPPSLVPMLGP
jgi:hypothetical protein